MMCNKHDDSIEIYELIAWEMASSIGKSIEIEMFKRFGAAKSVSVV